MASSAPSAPSETECSLSESLATVRVSSETPEGPPPAEAEESRAAQKGPRVKMRPELDGLTEALTLRIFAELDLRSLGAVKRVSRRLGRIARDSSLFRRVTSVCWESDGALLTNCAQLRSVRFPLHWGALDMFLGALAGLLEGGAALVSLELKVKAHLLHTLVSRLPALLAKHSVRLKALGCPSETLGLAGVVRSQPALEHFRQTDACLHRQLAEELAQNGPNIRHVDLVGYWGVLGASAALVPQLRSLVLRDGLVNLGDQVGLGLGNGTWGKLLFHAANRATVATMALAVEDFRREERGSFFLRQGKLWDAWDDADHTIPQPTNRHNLIKEFLYSLDK